jgi:ElaB/YqjD/DUF883 family membrane-anchored ribosome-binding protein
MSHVEQLERETEQTRTQIADTLDELKQSMTPSSVLHQLADRINDGAPAAFARNLKDQAVNNPLSIALIGAGLGWLMLGPRGSSGNVMDRSVTAMQDASDAAQERAMEAADAGRETAESVATSTRQTAGETADAVRSAAGSMSDSIQRTAAAGYETARRAADRISGSTRDATHRTIQSGNALLDFCREQPMVVAGLGLAMGAIVGALLPSSETEDRLMGDVSDRAKERAQDLASEQYENAKKVGERALDAAKDEAGKQAHEQEQTRGSKDDKQGHAETKADDATLVPSDQSEPDARGQPWSADNAPV